MEAIRICAVCGRVISEDDGWNIVNEGTDKEYIECDSCHDAEWESNKISVCAGCGGWFTVDMLHSEEPVPGHTFCPCPSCGKDFVEGMTRDEFLEEVDLWEWDYTRICGQCRRQKAGYGKAVSKGGFVLYYLYSHCRGFAG